MAYLSKADLENIAKRNSIPIDEVTQTYKDFQEELYTYREQTMTRDMFMSFIFYDKLYQCKLKKIDKFFNMLFDAFDVDGSGQITFEEYIIGKRLFDSKDIRDNIRFIFRLCDMSKDKKIEQKEIERFFEIMNSIADDTKVMGQNSKSSNKEKAKKMMESLDLDKNNYLEEEEFINGIAQNQDYISIIKSIKPS